MNRVDTTEHSIFQDITNQIKIPDTDALKFFEGKEGGGTFNHIKDDDSYKNLPPILNDDRKFLFDEISIRYGENTTDNDSMTINIREQDFFDELKKEMEYKNNAMLKRNPSLSKSDLLSFGDISFSKFKRKNSFNEKYGGSVDLAIFGLAKKIKLKNMGTIREPSIIIDRKGPTEREFHIIEDKASSLNRKITMTPFERANSIVKKGRKTKLRLILEKHNLISNDLKKDIVKRVLSRFKTFKQRNKRTFAGKNLFFYYFRLGSNTKD